MYTFPSAPFTIASYNGYGWKMAYWHWLTDSLTHSHKPNLEMLSHLKMNELKNQSFNRMFLERIQILNIMWIFGMKNIHCSVSKEWGRFFQVTIAIIGFWGLWSWYSIYLFSNWNLRRSCQRLPLSTKIYYYVTL